MLTTSMIVALMYFALAVAFLLVFPAGVYFYMGKRWNRASSIERLLMYFLVFLFVPGMLLLSPFLNLRPQPRAIED
jgi:NAD(P)H-quinone oxidoreductase subunit L